MATARLLVSLILLTGTSAHMFPFGRMFNPFYNRFNALRFGLPFTTGFAGFPGLQNIASQALLQGQIGQMRQFGNNNGVRSSGTSSSTAYLNAISQQLDALSNALSTNNRRNIAVNLLNSQNGVTGPAFDQNMFTSPVGTGIRSLNPTGSSSYMVNPAGPNTLQIGNTFGSNVEIQRGVL